MKHLLKTNNKEISTYLRDKQIECFTFNIIQYHPKPKTMILTKTFCFIEAQTNKCLRRLQSEKESKIWKPKNQLLGLKSQNVSET